MVLYQKGKIFTFTDIDIQVRASKYKILLTAIFIINDRTCFKRLFLQNLLV